MAIEEVFLRKRNDLDSLQMMRKRNLQGGTRICPKCEIEIEISRLRENWMVCPECEHYFTLSPRRRLKLVGERRTFREHDKNLAGKNPLNFPEYKEKIVANQEKLLQEEAVVTGVVNINDIKVAIGILDCRFLMGSMGTVVGEKVARLAEYADRKKLPLIIFSASGGARMQEGLFSLMQMAKTSAAIEKFKNNGGLYISCLTNPTTGGVSASFANLGDIIIAEPGALICFAGPRVIEQTIGEKLPEGAQRAEFLLEHGMVDMVVKRENLKETLYKLLVMHRR